MANGNPFPDPKGRDFAAVRAVLQRCCPQGVVVGSTTAERFDVDKFVWRIEYDWVSSQFPDPESFKTSEAKRILQRACPPGGVVGSVSTTYTINGRCKWVATYQRKKTLLDKMVKFLPCTTKSSLTYESSRFLICLPSGKKEMVRAENIPAESKPIKVFVDGVDVSRRVSKKTRISKASCNRLFRSWGRRPPFTRPYEERFPALRLDTSKTIPSSVLMPQTPEKKASSALSTRKEVTTVPGVEEVQCLRTFPEPKQSGAIFGNKITKLVNIDGSRPNQSHVPDSPSLYTAVPPPNSYAKVVQMSRLRDEKRFSQVVDYLCVEHGKTGYDRVDKEITRPRGKTLFELELTLKADGLPVGEDLLKLYLDYCASLGKDESASLRHLVVARKALCAMRHF